jgi:hypothetical protein
LASDQATLDEQRQVAKARRDADEPARILIACMPKSGSTFLLQLVCALPEFTRGRFIPPPVGHGDPELDETCLQNLGRGPCVAHLHMRNSERTTELYRKYRIKPVVLVRSLPDVVLSLRDHIKREESGWQMFHTDDHHAELDDARLEEMIVRLAAPWYVNFYMGWREARDVLLISYEEVIADPKAALRQIVDFAGAAVDDRAIARAVAEVQERRESRFNVGVAGRGAKLRPELLRDLVALFDFYPEAADDPYVKGVRAQAAAALEGRSPPPFGKVALHRPAIPASKAMPPHKKSRLLRAARRSGYQVTLILVGMLYWFWPEDLVPDDKWYGHIDDAVFLTLLAFLAGRVTKRTPGLRDLPSYLARAVRLKLRVNS